MAGLRTIVLVETGEVSVVALVESLVLDGLELRLTDLVQDDLERLVGPLEDGGVGDVELDNAVLTESLGTGERLLLSVLSKSRVLPALSVSTAGGGREGGREEVSDQLGFADAKAWVGGWRPGAARNVKEDCICLLTVKRLSLFHSDSPWRTRTS